VPTARLLTLLTCRPEFPAPWGFRAHCTSLTLPRLPQPQVAQMIGRVAGGKALPPEVGAQIAAKTDGVPLFVEEITKAVLESGALQDVNGQYVMTGTFSLVAIPATLHDSLLARLDRLGTAKAVAQYAAVLGRQFSYAFLQAVAPWDASTLQRELGRLVEAEMVYPRGLPPHATYVFKHALIQDAAYETLLRSTRQYYHQHIAQVVEAQFPETAATQPELLAHHYTAAHLPEKGIHYWYTAGQRASERSAHVEAIAHLRQGLALCQTLPETPERTRRARDISIALGASFIATKGYGAAEVGEAYTHARQLCEPLEEPQQLFPILRGLWNYYHVRAELQTAQALGQQLLTLAHYVQDTALLVAAHRALGTTLFLQGAAAEAHTHLAQGLVLYDLQHHRA
jgi:predicted ATPase